MSKEKQIEEKTCKKCLHYEMCLEKFRKAKADGFYEMTDEEEYFAHADECDFFITGYRKQEWISVEDRLPEPYKTVLVFCRNGFNTFQSVSEMLDENGNRWSAVCGIPVTHWMPLPEAPKMRKEDKGK